MDEESKEPRERSPSDEVLMASFLEGQRDAFYLLVQRYQGRMVNFCCRVLGNAVDAEDAAQEVFLKIFLEKDRYRRGEPLRPWLYTIAFHHCVNQLRRKKVIQWISLEGLLEPKGSRKPPSTEPRPDARLQSKEETAWLEEQIVRLPSRLRVPLVLKRFEGLPSKEIARILNISPSAVESRIHRALKQLRVAANRVRRGGKNHE